MFQHLSSNVHRTAGLGWQPQLSFTGDVRGFLKSVPLFHELPSQDLQNLSDAMDIKKYPPNSVVFEQGSKGDAFYVVTAGEAFVKVSSSNFVMVGQRVELACECKMAKTLYPVGTAVIVDKFDATRGYPFTARVIKTGDRGRLLPDELQLPGNVIAAMQTTATNAAVLSGVGAPQVGEERVIASCRAGDYFGEHALIKGSARNATIVAGPQGPLTVARLTKEKFEAMNLTGKLHFAKRKAVLAAQEIALYEQELNARVTQKTEAQKRLISAAIESNKNLHGMVHLTSTDRGNMVAAAFRREVKAKEVVIHEGDMFNAEFYIVESGSFQFSVSNRYGGEHDKIDQ